MMNTILLVATFCLLSVNGLGSFKYFGLSESGPEWGESNIPGVNMVDYVFPTTASIDYYVSNGMNVIRLPFLWERVQPTLNGPFDPAYFGLINKTVQYVTVTKGIYCQLDVHNYARYRGVILGGGVAYSAFQNLWSQLATLYKNNPKVIFGLMNEPYDIPTANVLAAMQAGINGIRATGATQLITVPGNDWTGAHSWVSGGSSALMGSITDPLNNFMYEMHQYFDNDYSGTRACNVNFDPATVFADATNWLRSQGRQGWLGEFGIENNANCVAVLARTMAYLDANADVWQGATWWAVGTWWTNYQYTLDAGKGDAQLAVLKRYFPSVTNTPTPTPTPTPAPVTPSPVTPVTPTAATTGRVHPATTGAKPAPVPAAPSTTGAKVTSPATTPAQTPSSSTCVSGHMMCLSTNTYSTCNRGTWAAAQTCGVNTVCSPSGDYIYCVTPSASTPISSPSSTPVTPAPVPTAAATTAAVATPAPVPTPAATGSSGTSTGSDSCSLGQSRCVSSNTYQSCANGRNGPVWATAQKCQTGLSCNQHGDNVYCY